MQASLAANTFAITGHAENKRKFDSFSLGKRITNLPKGYLMKHNSTVDILSSN